MRTTGNKEKILGVLLAVVTVAAIVYSSDCLFVQGPLSWHVRQKEYRTMILEVAALFAAFTMMLRWLPSGRRRVAGIAMVMAAFLWLHVVLVPVVVSGLYVWYLWAVGKRIRRCLQVEMQKASLENELLRDFLVGSMAVICLFCLMSAAGIGSIPCLWAAVLVTAAGLIIEQVVTAKAAADITKRSLSRQSLSGQSMSRQNCWESAAGGWLASMSLAFVLTMFCIQAGRMNIAVDYDSLWYGVRSQYILNNGHGIYENLGTMAVVYTYSKGLETLTLPLAVLPSYSFQISFNLWLAALALYGAFRIARYFMEKDQAWILTVFLSSIPGIMNMTITAKTDIATLLFQLIMIEELLRWMKKEPAALGYSVAALCVSWTLKPTALVFSTAVYGMGWLTAMVIRHREKPAVKMPSNVEAIVVSLMGIGALAFIWARTVIITGLPVTSVFSSIFTKLGFTMKYPYSVQTIPNSGAQLSLAQWMKLFLKRLYGVLLNPSGEDLNHVIIAWGSLAVLFLLGVLVVGLCTAKRQRSRQERELDFWLFMIFVPFAAGNLLSLAMLYQVDGNYFMLFYVLLGIVGFRVMAVVRSEGLKKMLQTLAVPVMVFSAVVMTLTNWSWTVGFSPADLVHRGYYDHQLAARDQMASEGNGQIWSILEAEPESRVIAIGTHPDVLALPCSVQSYDDIIGTNGNVVLVKTMDRFVEFMRYAGTDYVYVQAGYMDDEMRAGSLTRDLIEYGVLTPVCYEEGNVLAAVDTEGQWSEASAARLQEFLANYKKKGSN